MLQSLSLRNFTTFGKADFRFVPGLNLVVGENGAGKSHLLKVAYALAWALARRSGIDSDAETQMPTERRISSKLTSLFRPDHLGHLVRRHVRSGRGEIKARFSDGAGELQFGLGRNEKEVELKGRPTGWIGRRPVFLGPHELMTIFPNFISLSESWDLPFDSTWRDTCLWLGLPPARGAREPRIKELLGPLEDAMEGSVEAEAGRFYLRRADGRMEMHLVGEGLRKLATVAQLVATGSLADEGTLLVWDEPEANLNPRLIKVVARTILDLCNAKIQVLAATHSLFLMRELDILARQDFKQVPTHYIGLHRNPNDEPRVEQGESIDSVGDIAALDQELSQARRYLATGAAR